MSAGRTACLLPAVIALTVFAGGCRRETRPFETLSAIAQPAQSVARTLPSTVVDNLLLNAWAQSEGKRLFSSYNCTGCHANGGGAIGPALMDDEWIYGFEPIDIYTTIVEGRPNGMPAFRDRIPDYQVWSLVAYVRSMSGQSPIDVSPGRSDHLDAHTPEIIQPYQGRRVTGHK
jgi:cytochrome c oxidase cbb3-type subunit 3